MPEINVNPLKSEIFRVFTQNKQLMTFEDFLNMMSVFSENAPFLAKCHYAFKIFGKKRLNLLKEIFFKSKCIDLDGKNNLTRENIKKIIKMLTTSNESSLTENDLNKIVDKVFEEVDLDENNEISIDEFQHIVSNSNDFTS